VIEQTYSSIVADDHDIVRAGVKSLLRTSEHFNIDDEASSFTELMERLKADTFDILIVDLNMGDQNGLRAIRQITDLYPDMYVLVLSMFPEEPYALYSLHEGAHGYLHKSKVIEDLCPALNKIVSGKRYISPEYEETLQYGLDLTKQKEHKLASLSPREFEVYNLIVSGMSFKDIAQKLNLSPKTVSAHHAHILEKLSLSNVNQLIHFALQDLQ